MLAEHGPQAKVLAGGQSLVPVLAMRLAEPAHLVDINKISELDTVTTTAAGVTVGALARHSRVEHDAAAARAQPLLRQGAAAGRAPDDPQSRHDGRLARACRSGRGDDGGAGAVRGHGDRAIRPRPPGDHRGGLLPGAVGIGTGRRRAGRRGVLSGPATRCRHRLRRDRPPARRLRALRGRCHRRTRPGRPSHQPALRLSVGLRRAAGARRHAGLALRRSTMPPSRPGAPSTRRPTCTPLPTIAVISPVC